MEIDSIPHKDVEIAKRYIKETLNLEPEEIEEMEAFPMKKDFLTPYAPILVQFLPKITDNQLEITEENLGDFLKGATSLLSNLEKSEFAQRIARFLDGNEFIITVLGSLIGKLLKPKKSEENNG